MDTLSQNYSEQRHISDMMMMDDGCDDYGDDDYDDADDDDNEVDDNDDDDDHKALVKRN